MSDQLLVDTKCDNLVDATNLDQQNKENAPYSPFEEQEFDAPIAAEQGFVLGAVPRPEAVADAGAPPRPEAAFAQKVWLSLLMKYL